LSDSIYVPRGIDIPPLNETKKWDFVPSADVKVGKLLGPGDIYGSVRENALFHEHRIMV